MHSSQKVTPRVDHFLTPKDSPDIRTISHQVLVLKYPQPIFFVALGVLHRHPNILQFELSEVKCKLLISFTLTKSQSVTTGGRVLTKHARDLLRTGAWHKAMEPKWDKGE